jgi:type IV pilus assembly protein PilO
MDSLKRFPSFLLLVFWLGYLGFRFFEFNSTADGAVEQHAVKMKDLKAEVVQLNQKYKEGQQFLKTLDLKRTEIQGQAKKLADYQGALSEGADVPNLIKLLMTEARKLDMRVDKVEPGKKIQKEFYLEQQFNLDLRGSYQQVLLFVYRISQLQRILRVSNFTMRPSPISLSSRAMTLTVGVSVSAYQYSLSKEDALAKDESSKPGVQK